MLTALLVAASLAAPAFVTGADVSSLPACERAGAIRAATRDVLAELHARGARLVRVRVWHTPGESGAASGPAEAVALARRARDLGFQVMLCLHYSDTWADPAHQTPPRAWAGLRGRALEDSVRARTRDLVRDFVRAGANPDYVQVGNEVTSGMLWPAGRLSNPAHPHERVALARLLRAGLRGVREGSRGARTVLHIDRGGDPAAVERWFGERFADGVRPDVLALSYYPWWHGPLDSLAATLARLERFRRPLLVAETAHPWTLGFQDATHNVVGEPWRDPDGFTATPSGQHAFLARLDALLRRSPLAMGWLYWEPADVAGGSRGSAWENCALIDFEGRWLEAAEVWGADAGR